MLLHQLRISLADYAQLSPLGDSYSGQPSVIHNTTSAGDSRLIRRPRRAAIVFTEYVRNNRKRVNSQALALI